MRRILTVLGEDATYTHAGGGGVTVRGMFLSPYQSVPLADEVMIASSNPVFVGMSADLPLVARDDTITRGAVAYKVLEVKPDSPSGMTALELQEP